MKGIRLRDLPTFLRNTNRDYFMFNYFIQETDRSKLASAIVINTFDPLEKEVLESLQALLPPVYTIGPLHFLLKHIEDQNLKCLGSNLWKEDPKSVEWLDSKKPYCVVYVNFGSITVMTANQLIEFAWGLANSQMEFLWIIRPDIVSGEKATLPSEFMEETKERGMLRELMVGEKGKDMMKKAMEWKRLAEDSAKKPTGSSYLNIDKLINEIILSSETTRQK